MTPIGIGVIIITILTIIIIGVVYFNQTNLDKDSLVDLTSSGGYFYI